MIDIGTPAILKDPQGRASMMRTGALATVFAGCAILVGGAFGFAPGVEVTAENALWAIGLALTGKFIQRGTEAKEMARERGSPAE